MTEFGCFLSQITDIPELLMHCRIKVSTQTSSFMPDKVKKKIHIEMIIFFFNTLMLDVKQ